MKTSDVHYLGGLRTEAKHLRSGQVILTDAPVDNNGKGEAFSPTDLMATSLLSCMMTIVGIAAEKRGIPLGHMHGTVQKIMAEGPRRVAEIHVELKFEDHSVGQSDRRVLELAAINCPVAKSIHPDIVVNTHFFWD